MDMEAIEALNSALKDYTGTLIFVSHDREFVSSLATSIIDVKDKQLVSFQGTFEESATRWNLARCVEAQATSGVLRVFARRFVPLRVIKENVDGEFWRLGMTEASKTVYCFW